MLYLFILGMSITVIAQPTGVGSNEISPDIIAKLGRNLISSIDIIQDEDQILDVLIACDKVSEPNYIAEAQTQVNDIAITSV